MVIRRLLTCVIGEVIVFGCVGRDGAPMPPLVFVASMPTYAKTDPARLVLVEREPRVSSLGKPRSSGGAGTRQKEFPGTVLLYGGRVWIHGFGLIVVELIRLLWPCVYMRQVFDRRTAFPTSGG